MLLTDSVDSFPRFSFTIQDEPPGFDDSCSKTVPADLDAAGEAYIRPGSSLN